MAFDFKAVQKTFFDREKVAKLADKKTKSALAKFGAFVRRRAKSSIRKRKKPSAPGQPPSSHIGTLKNLIFFAYDEGTKSTVVGPVPFGAGVAPKALEHGGMSLRKRKLRTAKGNERLTATRPILIRKRPFMHPAMMAELPKFAGLFRG